MTGKNQSVGKGLTKWLGGPGCRPRAACCIIDMVNFAKLAWCSTSSKFIRSRVNMQVYLIVWFV